MFACFTSPVIFSTRIRVYISPFLPPSHFFLLLFTDYGGKNKNKTKQKESTPYSRRPRWLCAPPARADLPNLLIFSEPALVSSQPAFKSIPALRFLSRLFFQAFLPSFPFLSFFLRSFLHFLRRFVFFMFCCLCFFSFFLSFLSHFVSFFVISSFRLSLFYYFFSPLITFHSADLSLHHYLLPFNYLFIYLFIYYLFIYHSSYLSSS